MDQMAQRTTPKDENIERLRLVVHALIRAFLVSGRAGSPAQGRLPFNMLGHIRENGPTRPSALANVLEVPKTTISTASKALQNRGLMEQARDPEDGRAQLLALTRDGMAPATAILQQALANMQILLSQLSPDAHAPLLDQLEKVVAGVLS